MGVAGDCTRQHRRLGRRTAALLRLARQVHLDQHPHRDPPFDGAPLQLHRELTRIHGVHQGEPARDLLRLVALEMADHVPGRARPDGRVDLRQRLLHPVLTQLGEACGERRLHRVEPEPFGHGHERHRMRPSPSLLTPGDFRAHVGQPLGQGPKIHKQKNLAGGSGRDNPRR